MAEVQKLYPLKFKEVIRNYDFGDRNIPQLYPDKDLPKGEIIAETWEVTAHSDDSGRVINGPLRGKTLRGLVEEFGPELIGKEVYQSYGEKFPLLLKFLDAEQALEVQIHPKDEYAKENKLDELGKPEAWYILDAKPDSFLYWGTKEGVSEKDLRAVGPDEMEMRDLLMKVPVSQGDVLYVPPGKIHAIGSGIVLVEIQQTSDITIGPDYLFLSGQKIDEVSSQESFQMFLDQILLEEIPRNEALIPSLSYKVDKNRRTYLMASQYFSLEKLTLEEEWVINRDKPGDKNNFSIFTVLKGDVNVSWNQGTFDLSAGQTVLVPASVTGVQISPSERGTQLLKSYHPNLKVDVIEPLKQRGFTDKKVEALGGPSNQNDLKRLI